MEKEHISKVLEWVLLVRTVQLCKSVQSKQSLGCLLRACLHGGGGPQVGEVTRLGEVKK